MIWRLSSVSRNTKQDQTDPSTFLLTTESLIIFTLFSEASKIHCSGSPTARYQSLSDQKYHNSFPKFLPVVYPKLKNTSTIKNSFTIVNYILKRKNEIVNYILKRKNKISCILRLKSQMFTSSSKDSASEI